MSQSQIELMIKEHQRQLPLEEEKLNNFRGEN